MRRRFVSLATGLLVLLHASVAFGTGDETWVDGFYSNGMNARVSALTEYGGQLVAAGIFTTAGSAVASRIAVYDGVDWQPLGSGMNGQVLALEVVGSDLYAGGTFTNAGWNPCKQRCQVEWLVLGRRRRWNQWRRTRPEERQRNARCGW